MTFHKPSLVLALVAGAFATANADAQPAPANPPATQPTAPPTAAPPAPPPPPAKPPPQAPTAPPAKPPAPPPPPPREQQPPPAPPPPTAPAPTPPAPEGAPPGQPPAPPPAAEPPPAPAPGVPPAGEQAPPAPNATGGGDATGGDLAAGAQSDAPLTAPLPQPAPAQRPAPSPLIPVVLEEEQPEPQEPSVTPLSVDGSFWTRYEVRENYDRYSTLTHPRVHREGDRFVYRARLGLSTNPVGVGRGQAVLVRFSPQAYGTHSTGPAPETIADGYDLGVYEAYVRLTSRELDLDVGRFRMDYGDAALIGDLDWNEAGRAFQGGRIRFKGRSGYYTDVFATLISEGAEATGGIFEGDRYFYGIYTAMGPLIGDIELDAYILSQTWGSVAADPVAGIDTDQEGASFFTLGARIKQQIDKFDYRAEGGVQLGTTPEPGADALDKLAYQGDVGFGFTPVRQFRIGVGGLIASGDGDATDTESNAWNPLFPTGHKFLGLTDVFGDRTNALSGNLEVHYQPSDALILQLQGHALARMKEDNGSGDRYTGTEVDTHVIHPIGHGAKLRAMYGVFVPANGYWGRNDPIHYLEAQFGYDF